MVSPAASEQVMPHAACRLVVEVLSPSTAQVDRARKRALYARVRFPEYWIVDVDERVVERWRPDVEHSALTIGSSQAAGVCRGALCQHWHKHLHRHPLASASSLLFASTVVTGEHIRRSCSTGHVSPMELTG
jgi:hypothetical protein